MLKRGVVPFRSRNSTVTITCGREIFSAAVNILDKDIDIYREQHIHASDENRNKLQQWNNNLKNPSSGTKVRHGLKPEEHFTTWWV